MWPKVQETADLVTFTEKILYGNCHFSCGVTTSIGVGDFRYFKNKDQMKTTMIMTFFIEKMIFEFIWYYVLFTDSCTKGSSTIVFKKLTMSVEKGTKLQTGSDDKVVINQK